MLSGRLERIELSTPVPQTGVLPLNYSRHKSLVRVIVMLHQEVTIVAEPREILHRIVLPVFVDVVHRQDPSVGSVTQFALFGNLMPPEHRAIRIFTPGEICVLRTDV